MLRRKPSKIEVKMEEEEELEEARKRSASAAATTTSASTGDASFLHHFDPSAKDPSYKSHRIASASPPHNHPLQSDNLNVNRFHQNPRSTKSTSKRFNGVLFTLNPSSTKSTSKPFSGVVFTKKPKEIPSAASFLPKPKTHNPIKRTRKHGSRSEASAAILRRPPNPPLSLLSLPPSHPPPTQQLLRRRRCRTLIPPRRPPPHFYGDDAKCVISLKANAVIANGVSRVEEELDPRVDRECVADPVRLGGVRSRIMDRVKNEFGVIEGGFVCLGGFRNVRGVYDWNGLVLEMDETLYDFGTCYEIECESVEPEKDKKLIEEFLKENGIDYSYSEVSKYAVFRAGKLPL